MFVRVETPEQIETVACLARPIWREHYEPICGCNQVEYMLEQFQSVPAITKQIREENYQYYLIAPDGGAPVGYLAVQLRAEEMFFSKLYLQKPARGKGYGRAAIEFAAGISKASSKPYMMLTVNRKNKDTIAAYQKCGFYIHEGKITDIGNGFVMDDYILRKDTP
ncbi:MAG: GNAT family N-acetyltransferase [Kiritimatiellales bacterium]